MSRDQATDDVRLLRASASNPAAFTEFYERYEKAVLVFMLRRSSSPELAADLTAEVFASALEGAKDFRFTGAPPAAWLFGIARNVLVDSYRQARVQNSMRQRLGMQPLTLTDELAEDLERLAEQAQGAQALKLLDHLPDAQRTAMVAHILEDRDYEEIASELRCSPNVVRKRVSRGLAVLRRQMKTGGSNV